MFFDNQTFKISVPAKLIFFSMNHFCFFKNNFLSYFRIKRLFFSFTFKKLTLLFTSSSFNIFEISLYIR